MIYLKLCSYFFQCNDCAIFFDRYVSLPRQYVQCMGSLSPCPISAHACNYILHKCWLLSIVHKKLHQFFSPMLHMCTKFLITFKGLILISFTLEFLNVLVQRKKITLVFYTKVVTLFDTTSFDFNFYIKQTFLF